ncbi:MAG: UDP-N-acetyl-alpha-D-glucosamine C6 dehydratase [Actinobacteria bacterium ADurb.Bin346]|nr:MAG: UDP-N-acetyl-alpha-D-glucosamine C6 dehydratase [Actinobacteria bacterium ADurb.Bin346]
MKKGSILKIIRLFVFDVFIVFSSFIISFFLRGVISAGTGSIVFERYAKYVGIYILIILVIKLPLFIIFGMYRRVWKYASIKDMVAIVEAVALSTIVIGVIFYVLSQPIPLFGSFSLPYFPRSILIIDFLITILLVIISRFIERLFNEMKFGKPGIRKKRILICGAGDAGEMIVREIIRQRNSEYIPVGFLDDDPAKLRHQIHGVRVLAPINELQDVTQKHSVDEIIIAIPSAPGELRKQIAFAAKESGIPVKTLPSLYEVIDNKVYLYQVRDIDIEDILGREPIYIQTPAVIAEIKNKVVLITGAGGSIGSEICRQVIKFGPEKMILVDNTENNLFLIEQELANEFGFSSIVPMVADIRDKQAMKSIFANYKPFIIFHTAAYKHVSLMQLNPEAAIQNNFIGTKILAKLAIDSNVSRFVMLSTDKAVNPKSVMGLSKMLAEKYLQALSKVNNTRFMIVRFGNVLGSRGSVVPLFKEQIKAGGPIRITHPDMKRYFMTIPEAAQLVIQSCIMGKGGEIYVLDMGEQISILDLAMSMIKLYGMEPGKDIEIVYTGPRHGEKLNEELVSENEELVKTEFGYIFETKNSGNNNYTNDEIINILFSIEKELQINDYNNLFKDIKKIVPDFNEKEIWYRWH